MLDPKLYSLLAVKATGNFTRAAEQLSLTQPAVSQHVRALEQELGVRIFDRVNNAVKLTHEGEIVVKYAKRMMALQENMKGKLTNEKLQIASLTVGITHTAESNAIAEALARYVQRHENVTVKVITGAADKLCGMLKNYEIDLAIIDGKKPDPSLNYLMLDTDNLVLITSPNHRLAKKNSVTISDLKKERLILRLPTSTTHKLFVSALECSGMSLNEFNVVLEMDSVATIKDLIRRDFGVSVLARSACMDEISKRKIVALPIETIPMMMETNLVYAPDFDHPGLLKEIMRCYNETQRTNFDPTGRFWK